ncbi:hypothetical protein Peur_034701 [Populus x canadensis]
MHHVASGINPHSWPLPPPPPAERFVLFREEEAKRQNALSNRFRHSRARPIIEWELKIFCGPIYL